ncbi:hypothetical protein ASG73_09840 [Janibacter sp. Soil728]|uniref:alcohol dehydrogenase catalytic domain-containing protein n=1 Tax=Janibacter sp. Soil728 TaxID=1736393 RepID=UPI000700DE00|nr:alcohol dehydrogenase catalytic domain-containing protein [Janibacter sp. Soil728]KRE37905.1 hypothetical protein ASG73_09840 [Janibacter sp. Soil728]
MISVRSLPEHTMPVVEDQPEPTAGAGDVVIEMRAATINPADPFVLSGVAGEVFGLPDAVGLGYDVAGVVVAVGEGVERPRVGDRVAGLHDDLSAPSRGQAAMVALPASAVAVIPEGLGDVEAATVPLNALTARQALDLLGAPVGRSLLVTGAAGGVGGYAMALAVRDGWTVLGLARESDREFVAAAGAELVTELPHGTVDAVLDAAALQEAALPAVIDAGAFVGVLPPVPVVPERGVAVETVNVRADGGVLGELLSLTVSGDLPTRIAGSHPLAEAGVAYERFAEGGRGRWVLTH